MKKCYTLCLFFVLVGFANAQIINIPDANFKAKLLSASPSNYVASTAPVNSNGFPSFYTSIDTNNNGEIEQSEAALITYLDVSYSSISDLTGIEFFTNLQRLNCTDNQLTSLDVTGLTNLQYLYCFGNQLTTLDVTGLNSLQYLTCYENQLTTLNVTGLNSLQILGCDSNQLTNLNITGLNSLQDLWCSNNQLTTLDVTGLTNLHTLYCDNNQLETLFIQNNNVDWYNLSFNGNPNLQYICADEEDIGLVQSRINSYGYATTCHVNSYCSFTPGGAFYEIEGTTTFDFDANGCDANDNNYPNLQFSITDGTNSGSFIANTTGDFYIPVSAGSHTVTPVLENPTYFTVSPTSFVADFPTQTSPLLQDFCVTPNGVHHDIEVVFVPTTPARPGFDANYTLLYRNKGNQVANGAVTLDFNDAVVDLISTSVPFTSQSINTLVWDYTNLLPFETRTIDLVFNVNSPMETPAVNIDDVLNYTATITPFVGDAFQFDNTSSIKQVVVGSYDPNDKTCLEGEIVGPDMAGEYVHYVIRFENTGTYPAENIVVKDMIDLAKFDISTLIPLHSSHSFVTKINGNKVEFIFEGINLPFDDATNDGYIAFKIKTFPTLVLNDTFSNQASIYFDYNFPIITNEATTTIQVLSNPNFAFEDAFTLFPNPAKETISIAAKTSTNIQSMEIYNTLGQVVIALPNFIESINVSSLPTGTYFVKINTENGFATTKFVKE